MKQTKKHFFIVLFLFTLIALATAQSAIIPAQVDTMLESVRDTFTGATARTIIGIIFAGSCIAYAYNKDNEKMKGKIIAIMIGSGLLVLSQQIVNTVMTIN